MARPGAVLCTPAAALPAAAGQGSAQYRRAVGFVLMSSCLLSFNGLILRQVDDASPWQVIFYRSAALGVAMSLLFVFRHRRRALREFRRAGSCATCHMTDLSGAFEAPELAGPRCTNSAAPASAPCWPDR